MRKAFASVLFLLASLTPVIAQGYNPPAAPPWAYANNYGYWAFPGQAANTFTFTPLNSINGCQVTNVDFAGTPTFAPFSNPIALAPVFISDIQPANSEIVTPSSAFTSNSTTCGAVLPAVNNHVTFTLQSGTGGLQEALNSNATYTASYPTTIYLTPQWYNNIFGIRNTNTTLNAITPLTVLAAAKGSKNGLIVDVTTVPFTTWYWTGAAYTASVQSGTTPFPVLGQYWAFWVPPTAAAGTGAGTGPTISIPINSGAANGTVNLLTGTAPTASGPIFTLTWSATTGTPGVPTNNWNYTVSPVCTITSVGVNPYTGTNAVTGTTGAVVDTYTATATALAPLTAYSWTYHCH